MFQGKKIVTIYSGEFYVSTDSDIVIFTLLGSCVAVCLYDERTGLGGMNHFLLPKAKSNYLSDYGRFGLESMELMIGQFIKMGASHLNLRAKVFGGARMFDYKNTSIYTDIASENVSFILNYLQEKRIPITAQDLGGTIGRKIYYELQDHHVFLQRLSVRSNS
jgi:chemotaxis protein CheD